MKILRLLPLASLLLLFGCPYQSQVPVTKADLELDNSLFGKWQKAATFNSVNPNFLEISQADEKHYKILEFQYNETDSVYNSKEYTAHLSKVGERLYVNLLENHKPPYMIHELEQTGHSTFILREVTDNIDEQFSDSNDLEKFVSKHAGLSFFYTKEESVYQKMKQ